MAMQLAAAGLENSSHPHLEFQCKTNHSSKHCCLDRVLFFLFVDNFLSMGTVQLPTVAVCSRQTGLQADLRTSLRFRNGSSGDMVVSSADELIRLRKEENSSAESPGASQCRTRSLRRSHIYLLSAS